MKSANPKLRERSTAGKLDFLTSFHLSYLLGIFFCFQITTNSPTSISGSSLKTVFNFSIDLCDFSTAAVFRSLYHVSEVNF